MESAKFGIVHSSKKSQQMREVNSEENSNSDSTFWMRTSSPEAISWEGWLHERKQPIAL